MDQRQKKTSVPAVTSKMKTIGKTNTTADNTTTIGVDTMKTVLMKMMMKWTISMRKMKWITMRTLKRKSQCRLLRKDPNPWSWRSPTRTMSRLLSPEKSFTLTQFLLKNQNQAISFNRVSKAKIPRPLENDIVFGIKN